MVATAFVAVALIIVPQPPAAQASTLTSAGPLSAITISADLNCSVNHVTDSVGEWYGGSACGTFASFNGELFGPTNVPAGGSASPRTGWIPVSQTPWTGTGTTADPFTIVTVVRGPSGVTLTQTDKYVVGNEFYDTSITISNGSSQQQLGNVYTAGDCYLQGSDIGYGKVFGTSPACTTSTAPGARLEQLIPRTGGNSYYQAGYNQVWAALGTQQPLPNTCLCGTYLDNGAAISWPLNVGPSASTVYEWTTAFSPAGVVPMSISATADAPQVLPRAADGYTVTVSNPNATAGDLDSLSVTLPPGFTYTPGSANGFTTTDPTISGDTLTFTGPFTVPANGSISVHFGVTATSTPGTYTIDASGVSPTTGVTPVSGAAPITVLSVTDLAVTKTTSTPVVTAGGAPIVFDIVATNNGPGDASNVRLVDAVPAGLTFSAAGSSPSCFVLSGQVRCSIASLAAGASAPFTIAFTTSGTTSGSISNTVAIQGDVQDTDLSNNSASASFSVERHVDVGVTKVGSPATVIAGNIVTYTISVNNTGPSTANYTLVDALPAGVTAISMSGSGCTTTPTPQCSSTLAAGASTTVTLQGRVNAALAIGTSLVNTATVTTPQIETNTTNNTASATNSVVRSADLAIVKSAAASAVAGTTVVYNLDVTNNGPSVSTNPTVTDPIPAGAVFDPALSSPGCTQSASDVTCSLSTLAATGTQRFLVALKIPATAATGSTFTNTATVSGAEADPTPANNTSTVSKTVSRLVDLVATKSSTTSPVVAGGTISYTVTVTNRGPSQATGVQVTDAAPPGVTWTAASGTGATCSIAGGITCTYASLLPGDTVTLTFTGDLATDLPAGVVTNTVVASSPEPDAVPADNSATDAVNVSTDSGLELQKDGSAATGVAGQSFSYTLTLINRGPSQSVAAQLTDTLPVQLLNPSITAQPASSPCSITSGVLSCTFGTLPSDPTGASPITVTIGGTIDPATTEGFSMQNTARAFDTSGSDVTAEEVTSVHRVSTFAVAKDATTPDAVAGGSLVWTVDVTNNGPSVADAPIVLDTPDTAYTITSMTVPTGTCTVATLTCSVGELGPGQTATITVTGTVSPDRPAGPIVNRATVFNPNGPNVADTATVPVIRVADLSVTKSAAPNPVLAGDPVVFSLRVSNAGPSSATGTTITDTLLAGLTFDPLTSSAGCAAAGQVVTCTAGTLAVGGAQSFVVAATTAPGLNGTFTNAATADSTESDPDGATASADFTVVPAADISITKTGQQVIAGENLTWTMTVANAGPSNATGVVVSDTLAATLTFVSGTGNDGTACTAAGQAVTCALVAPIAPGGHVDIQIATTVASDVVPLGSAAVSVPNTATVTATTPDPTTGDHVASATAVVATLISLTPSKTGPTTVVAGTDATYTVGTTNNGPSRATNVDVIDRLDPQLTFVAAASDPACRLADPGTNEVRCHVDTLAVGAGVSFPIVVHFSPSIAPGSNIVNTATSVGAEQDNGVSPPASVTTAVTGEADVSMVKEVTSPVAAGADATYTFTIHNAGPSSAVGLEFNDQAPSALTGGLKAGAKGLPECPTTGVRFQCVIPELQPGQSITITMVVGTDASAPDGTTINNTATVTSALPDPDTSNNTDGATLTLVRSAKLQLTKTPSVTVAAPGSTVDWTLTLKNLGPSISEGATVVDTLPDGLTATTVPAACDVAGQVVTCEAGTLEPGDSAKFVIGTKISDDFSGTLTNSASVTADGSTDVVTTSTITVNELAATGWGGDWLVLLGAWLIGIGLIGVALGAIRRRVKV